MKRIKVVYILSNVSNAPAFIWITKGIDRSKIDLNFILFNPGPTNIEKQINDLGVQTITIQLNGKKDYPSAWFKCYRTLKLLKPDVVHCHLFDANLIGLSVAKVLGVKRRVHTRHHGDLHHEAFPRGVWLDKLVNLLSTEIVAPSEMVKKVLVEMDGVKSSKVKVIHHGFDFSEFTNVDQNRILKVREKHGINEQSGPIVGVISRWTEWKGVHYAIAAFTLFLADNPNAILVLANAGGDYENEIRRLLDDIPEANYRTIVFEEDVAALYQTFDVYVHVPIRDTAEAFGQTYIEAICANIPSIFTKSGVFSEIPHAEEFRIVNYENSTEIYESLKSPIPSPHLHQSFFEKFEASSFISKLDKLYTEC